MTRFVPWKRNQRNPVPIHGSKSASSAIQPGTPSTTIIIKASHLRQILARWLDQINFSVRAVSRRSGRRRSQSSYYYHTNPAPLQPGSFAVSTRCPAIALSYTAVVVVGKINGSFEDICAGMVPESHRGASTEIRSTQK